MTGFEQVAGSGSNNASYYLLDYGTSRVILYNQNWIYQSYKNLSISKGYSIKYVENYFYFSSDNYFFKTDVNFNYIQNYTKSGGLFKQIYFLNTTSLFYVNSFSSLIYLFNTNCTTVSTITVTGRNLVGLNYFGNSLFVGTNSASQVLVVLTNSTLSNTFAITACTTKIYYLTIDEYGYMAVSCNADSYVAFYDYKGIYMGLGFNTTAMPFQTAVDSSGRFIVCSANNLLIYF